MHIRFTHWKPKWSNFQICFAKFKFRRSFQLLRERFSHETLLRRPIYNSEQNVDVTNNSCPIKFQNILCFQFFIGEVCLASTFV